MNFQAFVSAQQRWSANTFGRGSRFEGIMKHIRKELSEIEADPSDATEYADVIILVADLAWRQGITPHQLTKALEEKQLVNFSRVWNVAQDDQPCEHIPQRQGKVKTLPKIYPGYFIKAGDSGWLEVVGTQADIENPNILVIRYQSDRDDHVYECFDYNLMDIGKWDSKEKQVISIWKYTGEEDQETEYHSEESVLRAKALEAMKYLNENSDLYVIDVSHQEGLTQDLIFPGGTFRVWVEGDTTSLSSATHLVNRAMIHRGRVAAKNFQDTVLRFADRHRAKTQYSWLLSPEAQDELKKRLG